MSDYDVDVLIVGGGLVGAILSLALRTSGLNVQLVDNNFHALENNTSSFDARSLALSIASIRILKQLQLFDLIEKFCTPITSIHISEQGAFGQAHLLIPTPLGYVVELYRLQQAIFTQLSVLDATCVDYDCDKQYVTLKQNDGTYMQMKVRIVVAADGSNSSLRQLLQLPIIQHAYIKDALVANIGLARAHHGAAYERFTATGPFACLPLCEQRVAMVWSLPQTEAIYWQQATDMQFLAHAQRIFGYRLGRWVKVGQRTRYPLFKIIMPISVKANVVFIGNAAHTLHPVAGQGFNLGLRDVAMLAQCLIKYGPQSHTLIQYQQARAKDQHLIINSTDQILNLFATQIIGIKQMRGLGLLALDNCKYLQKILVHYASGFGGIVPDLVCGLDI